MAATQSREEWLKQQLDDNINWFRKEADKHKRMHYCCRYLVFALTIASTVLASVALIVSGDAQNVLNAVLVFTTAGIGAVASFEGMRKPAEKWHTERRAEVTLKDVKRDLEFGLLSTPPVTDVGLLYWKFTEVMQSSREAWSKNVDASIARPGTGDQSGSRTGT